MINIFKQKELNMKSVVKDSLTTASDSKRYSAKFYLQILSTSLGAIILRQIFFAQADADRSDF
jgi:hypothetical protein